MQDQPIILKTNVDSSLKRRVLLRGSLLGALGAFIILFSGMFMPKAWLTVWGLPLFLGGLALIWLGLRPYRYLSRLELKPAEIHLWENRLTYKHSGKVRLSIPISEIKKIDFYKDHTPFGMVIYLNEKALLGLKKPGFIQKLFFYPPFELIGHNGVFIPYIHEKASKIIANVGLNKV